MTKWYAFKHSRWQYVPESIVNEVRAYYEANRARIGGSKLVSDAFIDLPRMVMSDRSTSKFQIDGLEIEIPTSDVRHFYEKLSSYVGKPVGEDGPLRYVMFGWQAKIWFDADSRMQLLTAIQSELPEIDKIAESERDEFNRRIANINKDGVKVVSVRNGEVKM